MTPHRTVGLVVSLLLATVLGSHAAAGTLATWTGGGTNGLWSTAGNWTGTAPVGGGTSALVFSGSTRLTSTNDLVDLTIDSLSFTTSSTNFILTGNRKIVSAATITTTATSVGNSGIGLNGDVISLGLLLTDTNTITTGAGHNLSLSGTIGGTGALVYHGAAAVYLSGSNSYSGGTFINGGSVWTQAQTNAAGIGDDNAFGIGTVTVGGSGSLLARNTINLANTMVISGTGNSANAGAIRGSFGAANQTATISGSVTLAGNAQIEAASSFAGDSGSKLLFTNVVDTAGNTLTLGPRVATASATSGLTIEFAGGITGAGAVVVNGGSNATSGVRGVVLMSGSNSYTVGTTVTQGILRVTNADAVGTGPLAVNTNGLQINGVDLNAGALSGSSNGVISTGTTGAARLVTSSTANSTYAGTITNGTAGGSVGLTKAGSGSLTLTGSNGYTGSTRVNGGVLALGSANALAGTGTIAFGGGTLQYSAANQVDYSSRITDSGSAISIDTNGQSITFASALAASNTAGLTKSGSGTLFLNGTNLFTGTTTVAAGTLGGAGSVTGAVVVSGAAILSPGATASSTGILGVGALSMAAANSTVVMSVTGTTAGTTYDQILFAGSNKQIAYNGILDLSLSGSYATGTTFDLFSGFTSNSGHFTTLTFSAAGSPYDSLVFEQIGTSGVWQTGRTLDNSQLLIFNENTGQLVVVPEPSTLFLVGMAVAVTGWSYSRRRRRSA